MTFAKTTVKLAFVGVVGALAAWGGLAWTARMPAAPAGRAAAPESSSELQIELALQRHVQALAETIGQRNDDRPQELLEACDYVQTQLSRAGLRVTLDRYEIGRPLGNVIAEPDEVRGGRPILLLTSHFDSPLGSPGAESSASSTAVLIELARLLRRGGGPNALRFMACAYEQQPMADGSSGRRFSLRHFASRRDPIACELQLDSLGVWRGARTQRLPFPWSTVLPKRSDYLLLAGGFDAREPLLALVGDLRKAGRVPVEGIAGPAFWPGLSWCDRGSLFDQGPPRILVTDTGRWRHPDCGTAMDRPETLDYASMARVVIALAEVLVPGLEP
jgi:hypothetical protein